MFEDDDIEVLEDGEQNASPSNYSNNISKKDNENLKNTIDKNKKVPNNEASKDAGKVKPNSNKGTSGIDNGNQFKKAGNVANMSKGLNSKDPEEQKQAMKNMGKDAIKPIVRKGVQAATGGLVGSGPVTGKIIDNAVDKVAENPNVDKIVEEVTKKINKTKKKVMLPLIMSAVQACLLIFIALIAILSPVILVEEFKENVSDFFASFGNWFIGNGWCDSKESCQEAYSIQYQEEIDEFSKKYKETCSGTWNSELITATIFYEQMALHNKVEITPEEEETEEENVEEDDESESIDDTDLMGYNYKNAAKKVKKLTSKLYPNIDDGESDDRCDIDYNGYRAYLYSYIKSNYKKLRSEYSDEDIVADIMAFANQPVGGPTSGSISGNLQYGAGFSETIPSIVLQNSQAPYGTQYYSHTSCFGYYNMDCGSHNGIDIAGGSGTEVYSIADGVVEEYASGRPHCNPVYQNGRYVCPGCLSAGNYVLIKHTVVENGETTTFYSRYLHMDTVVVTSGQNVSKGQLIGVEGNTGCSTGSHLHFEMWDGDKKHYNGEELLRFYNLPLKANCQSIRDYCEG